MSVNRYDAWVFAKELAGQPVNGELAAMSDEMRPLGWLLATMLPHERPLAWQGAKVLALR